MDGMIFVSRMTACCYTSLSFCIHVTIIWLIPARPLSTPSIRSNPLSGAKLHSLIIVAEDSSAVFVFQHSRRRVSPPFLNSREVAKDRAIRLAHNDRSADNICLCAMMHVIAMQLCFYSCTCRSLINPRSNGIWTNVYICVCGVPSRY